MRIESSKLFGSDLKLEEEYAKTSAVDEGISRTKTEVFTRK
jgi:hypothetical protein